MTEEKNCRFMQVMTLINQICKKDCSEIYSTLVPAQTPRSMKNVQFHVNNMTAVPTYPLKSYTVQSLIGSSSIIYYGTYSM